MPRKHSLMWYVENYGLPLQTVRNYRKKGWPLENPARLLELIMAPKNGQKPPIQKLMNLVNGQDGPTKRARAAKNAPNPPAAPPAPPPGTTASEDVPHDLFAGLAAELKRLEQETADSYANYKAEKLPAEKLVKQAIYIKNVNALRALAKDAPKADRDAKNTLPIGDVDSAWSRSFKEFRSSLEAMGRRLATNPLFKKLDPVDVEELVNKETGEIIAHLETGSWLKTEEPAA